MGRDSGPLLNINSASWTRTIPKLSVLPSSRADVVVESNQKVMADIKVKETSEKPSDLYAELPSLDDLRKRGILSEEEFQSQKKKLLKPQEEKRRAR